MPKESLFFKRSLVSQNFFTLEISDPRFEANNLRHITVKSPALGGRGDISVFVPEGCTHARDLPVVMLLHGVYGSHWSWAHQAGVHFTAQKLIDAGTIKPMILAMPSDGLFCDGSGYMAHQSADYEQWIVQDVPSALRELLPMISEKSEFYIAGLSMGGYGALRLGAKYPQVFRAFSGLSSITEFSQLADFYEPDTFHLLAEHVKKQESVLDVLLSNRQNINPFRFDCGTEDSLFKANQELHTALNEHGIEHTFEPRPGGHAWNYWEASIGTTLEFFSSLMGKKEAPSPVR